MIFFRKGFLLRARFSRVNSLVLEVMSSWIMAAQLLRTTMALKIKHWGRQASEATHTASDSRTSSDGGFSSSSLHRGHLFGVLSLLTRYVLICRYIRISRANHMSSLRALCDLCEISAQQRPVQRHNHGLADLIVCSHICTQNTDENGLVARRLSTEVGWVMMIGMMSRRACAKLDFFMFSCVKRERTLKR